MLGFSFSVTFPFSFALIIAIGMGGAGGGGWLPFHERRCRFGFDDASLRRAGAQEPTRRLQVQVGFAREFQQGAG